MTESIKSASPKTPAEIESLDESKNGGTPAGLKTPVSDSTGSRTIARFIRRRIARQLVAMIAVVLALLLRVTLDRYFIALPTYVTFYPVVFLAAILGGMWEGILATTLSALLADYFLLPPVGQFSIHSTSDVVGLTIFSVSGVSVSVIAELYRRSRERRAVSTIEAAILNESRRVQEPGEQTQILHAERLRFLEVLGTLRAMNGSTVSQGAVPIAAKFNAAGRESRSPSLDQGRFRASLRRTVLVPFIAALVIAGAGLWAAYDLNSSMRWVDHTDQVIGQSRRLLKLTVDMETGERGYLVTGNEAFLQPYQEASKVIDFEYQALYRMVADNSLQQARLERLRATLNHWRGYAEQMIALRRSGGAYTDLKMNLAGKGEVDEIRDEIARFQSVEEHLRDERNRAAHRDWRLAETICILLGLGVGLGLVIFTFQRMETIAATFEESGRALAESERRWATTLASIGDAVMAADNQGRVTFLNPAAIALTGWQSEEAQGQPIQSVFHIINEQTRGPAEDIVGRVLKDGRTVELANHTALLRKDGREIPIADSAAPILDSDGKIAGVVLVFRDVTERRRADDALRESQTKLEAALAAMTDSVIITDAEGRFVQFNDAYAKFYRFKSKAECARSFDEFATNFEVFMANGERVPREMYAIQRALRGETATNAEYTLRRKDTGESWIGSLSFSPIRDKDGAIIGSVVTARDITEAKRTEEERQIAIDFLGMVNQSRGAKDLLQRAATFFQQRSGCEAVGIRLREGEDYPYFEARGFSNEFIRLESKLCVLTASGKAIRDSAGKPVLECLCGNVIRGKFESSKPFYTAHGSFWSNSTTDLVAGATEGDLPSSARHRCNRAGYESVALFPIYVGQERLGLLQLNDRRKGRFSPQSIVLWERLAGHLATAVSKFRAEEALQESEKRYHNLFNSMNEGFCVIEVLFDSKGKPEDYRFLEVNDAFEKQTGMRDAVGKRMRELAPDHEEHWFEIYGRIAMTGEPEHFINEAKALNRFYDVHAYRVGEPQMRRVAIVFTDFSDYKRAEEQLKKLNRTLKALSNSNQAILHATDEPTFLKEVCRMITGDCGHAMVWIGVAEHDEERTVRPIASSGFEEGYLETLRVTWDESDRGRGPTGTVIRTGEPAMCRNMLTDPAFDPWREDAIKRGYASSLAIPLKEQGEAWGTITIYSRETDAFSEAEIELLTELARDVEFGIHTLRLRTARALAEQSLRESEELLGLFVEHAPAALAMFDREMRYLHASRRWRADFGLGDRDLSGVSHYDVFPEISEQWKEAHRRGLAGEVLREEADRFERADGSEQWIRWEIRPWCHADGKVGGIVIFTEEISERMKAQEALLRSEKEIFQRQQLRALAERMRQVREEERKMVARDLHDQIGQILTAIKMDMAWAVRHLPDSEGEVHNRLKDSIELINDGVQSVRRICSGLRPGILDDLGLAAAIEWQANEFGSRTGISCKVTLPPAELHIDGDRSTAVFRIFQECLTNVARHAEAQSVSASLNTQDEDLLLVVRDDGKGFRESEVSGSLGVLGMKERAKACGGDVQVSSSPGKGTTVTVRVPVRAASGEREDNAYSDRR
ncbi:MAG: PAS domain S-box protein [Terracidiphilus sp.]